MGKRGADALTNGIAIVVLLLFQTWNSMKKVCGVKNSDDEQEQMEAATRTMSVVSNDWRVLQKPTTYLILSLSNVRTSADQKSGTGIRITEDSLRGEA